MKFKIGLVEKDAEAQYVLMSLFKDSEFDVSAFLDAASALRAWQKETPHLVLFEWNLPDLSGVKFCQEISERFPSLPFYILSDLRDMDVKITALQAGALDFISKPFDRNILLAKVRAALRIYLTRSSSNGSGDNGIYSSNEKPSFIEHMISKNMDTISPSPDLKSKNGFSYKLFNDWNGQKLNPDQQVEFLENLVKKGWLVKRIFDVVKTCPKCSSSQLNIRNVCPECHSPIFSQDNEFKNSNSKSMLSSKSQFYECTKCHSRFEHSLSFARCWSCEVEFKDEKAKTNVIYSFSLSTSVAPDIQKCELQNILEDNGLQTLPENMFEAFLKLEKRQHNLVQKPYAILHLCFSKISTIKQSSEDIKKIGHIVLLLKKLIQPQETIFCKAPNELILFFSYTTPHLAEDRTMKIRNYLSRMELASFVQLDLTTHNYSKVLDILEREVEAV